MSGTPLLIAVDIDKAAHKVLRDPKGLSGVAATDLIGLAQFALQADEEPRLTAELAAAIAVVIKARTDALASAIDVLKTGGDEPDFSKANAAHAATARSLSAALDTLQTLFELEFPR